MCLFGISLLITQIINVLITLSEDPYIRYYSPPTSFHPEPLGPGKAVREHVSARIARWVMGGMEAHKSMVPDFPVRLHLGLHHMLCVKGMWNSWDLFV